VYTPLLTQVGVTDYGKATADFQTTAELFPAEVVFKVLNDLLSGLEATGNRGKWGFAGWPLLNIEPADRDAVVFGGERSFHFDVEAALIDGAGKTIGTDRFFLTSGSLAFSSGARRIDLPTPARSTVTFRQVSVLNYTPPLSIRITRINGNAAEAAIENGYMRILTQAEYDVLPDVIAQRQQQEAEVVRATETKAEAARQAIALLFKFRNGVIQGYNGTDKNVIIPDTISGQQVTGIGEEAFKDKNLTGVTIPNRIISIGSSTFRGKT
jgi:hypothetical protein